MKPTRMLATILSLLLLVTGIAPLPARAQDEKDKPGIKPGQLVAKTRLEARSYSGGDLDSSFPWERNVIITSRAPVYFRWATSEQNVTSAEWQVTGSPAGFSGAPNIIASGELSNIPGVGQRFQFTIDFKQFLPASPPASPKNYYVRIVPRKGRHALIPSPTVKVVYQKPGEQAVIQDFNLDRFEQNLKARLEGRAVGYSYAIYEFDKLKKSGAGGHAVWPNVAQSPDKRMTTMSMSKTITAAAVMKAMEELRAKGQNITINSLIAPYLPSGWTLGPRVDEITFKHLLTHTGGLRPAGNDPDTFAGLRQTIANGSTSQNFGKASYANANFCLFRVIIPYMVHGREKVEKFPLDVGPLPDLSVEHNTAKLYVRYVQEHVLAPIGLGAINVVPTGATPYTRYYKFSDRNVYIEDPKDDTAMLRTGAGYWFMSANEFAKLIASLRHHGKIVSSDTFKVMRDNDLGMYGADSAFGRTWDHNGGYTSVDGAGSAAAWMIFTNGITAVILVNSQGGLMEAPQDVIRNAFNDSW
jgi:CubicO group peptidase (beta-lactamase class C family)